MTRRLAALLAADVAGYSRLMHENEEATYARFTEVMRSVIEPAVAHHAGRIVKHTGDGFLAEFASAVEAVTCALQFQDDVAAIAADDAREGPLEFRVGIHVGEVIVEDGDIFGDGVNIAVRINGAAPAGGIMISDAVHENVRGRLACGFEDQGAQQVKNIARSLHLFRVIPAGQQAAGQRAAAAGAPAAPSELPAIAVLPFENLSGDPEQDNVGIGLVEDLVTALARFHTLFVIARKSAFAYKGRDIDVRQVGRELGARYVVQGSLRKIGTRMRVGVQAVLADSGAHLWADRFDYDLVDVFAAQDETTRRVVAALAPALERAEIERARRKPAQSPYELYLQALAAHRTATRASNDAARSLVGQALALDPDWVPALVLADASVAAAVANGWLPVEALDSALGHVRRAAELAPEDGDALAALARRTAMASFDAEQALLLVERAIAANPLSLAVWRCAGYACLYAGRPERAAELFGRARLLAPDDGGARAGLAYALLEAGHDHDAMEAARQAAHHDPASIDAYRVLTAGLGLAGRGSDAAVARERLLALDPACSIATVRRRFGPAGAGWARLSQGLRAAGLAEAGAVRPPSRPSDATRIVAGEAGGMAALRALHEPRRLLLVSQRDVPAREVPIGAAPLLIGRAADADLVLSDNQVSRAHCRIVLADDAVTATDLNSTNGTLLDGRPITRTTTLRPGSVLQIGEYRLEYCCEEAADPEATMAGRPRDGLSRRLGSEA